MIVLLLLAIVFVWDPVTTDIYGKPIKVSHYALYKRKIGEEWPVKHFATRKGTTYTMSTVPSYPIEVAVKAVVIVEYKSDNSNIVRVE